jgi:hypothetical protein
MTDITTISRQLDSTPKWQFSIESSIDDLDTLVIVSPSGVTMSCIGKAKAQEFTLDVLRGGEVITSDGTRLRIDWEAPNGLVFLIDTDKWVNPNSNYLDIVCEARELCYIVLMTMGQING